MLTFAFLILHNLTTRPVSPTTGEKEYKLQDHLGSTRVVIHESGTVTSRTDNDACGEIIWQSGQSSRKGYIDKETDTESNLGDYGERKYDAGLGRFGSIDRYWENYRDLTPYQYAGNNPLIAKDPSGMLIEWQGTDQEKAYGLQKYNESIAYLESKGAHEAADNLKKLRDSKDFTVKVYASEDVKAAQFDYEKGLLEWNPTLAAEVENAWLSPAELLAHEGDHATSFYTDKNKHIENSEAPDYMYNNVEERRVITGSETRTARKLEHLKDKDLDSRPSHSREKVTFHVVKSVSDVEKSNEHTNYKRRR